MNGFKIGQKGKRLEERIISAVVAVLMFITLLPLQNVSAVGSEPTLADGVYQIANYQQLLWFADKVNNDNGNFATANAVLTADIVSDGTEWTPIGYWDSDENEYYRYNGTFDGQKHSISGLECTDTTKLYVGLFGYAGSNSQIENIRLIDSSITGYDYVGSICGFSSGTITNCYNSAPVSGHSNVGGIAGYINGTITNSYNSGKVTGEFEKIGGICGTIDGRVQLCVNVGAIEASQMAGGIIGYSISCTMIKCISTGSITATNYSNALLGYVLAPYTPKYSSCYYRESVGSDSRGESVAYERLKSGEFAYMLNNGVTDGTQLWYQRIGWNEFPTLMQISGSTVYAGGRIHCDGVPYEAVFTNDITASTRDEHSFVNGICSYCGELEHGIPVLADGYYEIGYPEQLRWFANEVNSGNNYINGKLMNNITLSGEWTPIGTSAKSFNGTFDGQGYTVGGISCSNTEKNYTGLFGCADNISTIKNVGIVNSTIKGKENVGGVCGLSYGTIENCYNEGTIDGTSYVGGICGYSNNNTVKNCYNIGTVTGESDTNSVCGYVDGTVANCYFLAGTGNDGNGTSATTTQFNSGEITYKLNGGVTDGTQAWYQKKGTDSYPTLIKRNDAVVYASGRLTCNGNISADTVFSNDSSSTTYRDEHNFVEGICSYCGEAEIPKLVDGYYEINCAAHLIWFSNEVKNTDDPINGKLMNNITLSGEWTPIGTFDKNFNGTFDGQGYTVSGISCTVTTANYVGLFGYAGTASTIKNVGVINSSIAGKKNVGGVCGLTIGTIENCYNEGTISGTSYVGGVCGNSGTSSGISNCYNKGTIDGTSYIGGVCGKSSNKIQNCYNVGTVSEGTNSNSVCGSGKTVTNCYFLAGTGNGGYGTSAIETQFNSGEIAYLLNGGVTDGTQAWYQKINTDHYPTLKKSIDDFVYVAGHINCDGTLTPESSFSNEDTADTLQTEHTFVNGVCSNCGEYEHDIPLRVGGYYEIYYPEQLVWFAKEVNSGNKGINGKLMNNITLSGEWTPIGTSAQKFNGTFDGQDYTVSGISCTVTTANYVGLFGCTESASMIKNVGIINSSITGNYYVGGVCGYNGGTIENCYNEGTVIGESRIGGVCGNSSTSSVISNCYNSGAVSGTDSSYTYVGGICGYNNGTTQNCYNIGMVSGASDTNSVCGYGETVTNCYFLVGTGNDGNGTSAVEAQFNSGEITYKLNSGVTDGTQAWYQKKGTDSYPTLNKRSDAYVYATRFTCNGDISEDTTYSNDSTASTRDAHSFVNGICSVCGELEHGLPELEGGYYEIEYPEQLRWFANEVNRGEVGINGKLMNNITLSGEWTPIGTSAPKFSGTFDGQNYTVSGISCTDTTANNVGLFGRADTASTIKNVGVINSSITGKNYVGGVCGYTWGTIENCYNKGTISGVLDVGGVCGINQGIIENCYNEGTISGVSEIGGVCGGSVLDSDISNCYNSGAVSGMNSEDTRVGGICGSNDGTAQNCYNVGTVSGASNTNSVCGKVAGTVTNCYFLNGKGTDSNATSAAETQFNSGEITYKLNGGVTDGTQAWYQTCKTGYPSLTKAVGTTVSRYEKLKCDGTSKTPAVYGYTNDSNPEDVKDEHNYVDGKCTVCGDSLTTPLAAPTNLAWDSTIPAKATWGEVANASGYLVQLYKGDAPLGDEVSVTGTFYDFTSVITATGTYTFTVKAKGDEATYLNSDESAKSGEFYYVAFSGLTANGTANTTDTTALTITLSQAVTGLAAEDITVIGATRGVLSGGTNGVYTLAINNITVAEGANVEVTLSKAGYTFSPASKTVAIHKAPTAVAPTITTTSLTSGTVGTAYSQTLEASGDTPITWSVSAGALPAGLTLNASTGIIGGNPTTEETSTFTVKATNGGGEDTQVLSITINAAPPVLTVPTITTTSLTSGTVGTAYSQTLEASGDTPITWEVSAGTLPAGLTLNASTGIIGGNPTTSGTSTFTVKATNGGGEDTQVLSIAINEAPPTIIAPTITTTSLTSGTVGTAYSQTLEASGDTPITWEVSAGTLPAGLTLNASTGIISGNPTTEETSTFTVKATNGGGEDTQVLSITINAAPPVLTAPTITTTSLTSGTVGTAYSQTLEASGDTPITWEVSAGTLPAGLTLNASTGIISGNPTTEETSTFTVKATNGGGEDTQVLSITINAAPPTIIVPTITTTSLTSGTVGTTYSQTLEASGDTPITWSVSAGTLPAGLTLNASTGIISGNPTTEETSTFTVKATNGGGEDTQALSITINAAPPTIIVPTITTTSLTSGTVGTAYSQTLEASGDTPITWEVSAGTLPAGLTLNASTGIISGNPTTEETSTFTVKATNGGGEDTQVLSITINAAPPTIIVPTITTTSLTSGTVGTAYSQTLEASGDTPITWEVSAGTLPAGLTLNASTGIISGNPTTEETSTFTVKATNGGGEDTQVLSITINSSPTVIHSINAIAGVGGTISPYGSVFVNEGANQTFTISAYGGYSISDVKVDSVSYGATGTYTFYNVTGNHTIEATFSYNGGGTTGGSTGGSTSKVYHFIKGANSEWESISDEGLEFTVDGEFSKFLRAEVDGEIINKGTDYTVKSGSTIITLTPEYLKTLEAGTHKLTAVYRDGSVTTDFEVIIFEDIAAGAGIEGEEETLPDEPVDADEPKKIYDNNSTEKSDDDENPNTGNSLSGVFAVAILALATAGIAIKKRRK